MSSDQVNRRALHAFGRHPEEDAGHGFVLVEGFKSEGYLKIAIVRCREHLELLGRVSPILAVASWLSEQEIHTAAGITTPVFGINEIKGLLKLVLAQARPRSGL